jgi:hypothetical protein
MYGVVLLKSSSILSLAHQDQDGRSAIEERVTTSFIGLPRRHEVRQALLEEVLVDLDVCHGGAWLIMAEVEGKERQMRRRDGCKFRAL